MIAPINPIAMTKYPLAPSRLDMWVTAANAEAPTRPTISPTTAPPNAQSSPTRLLMCYEPGC